MTESRHRLIDAALEAQTQVALSLLALAEPDWLALDLTLTQLKSLIALVAVGSVPVHQLAEILHLGRPATSTLIDQLARLELVARMEDAADRRRTLVSLTPQGKAYLTRLRQGRDSGLRELLDALPDDDLAALAQGMRALGRIAAARRSAPTPQP